MYYLGAPEDPLILTAFYVILIKYGLHRLTCNLTKGNRGSRIACDPLFGKRLKSLDATSYDELLHELSTAASGEAVAATALEIGLDFAPEGTHINNK
jgi:hypothetical protein